MTALLSVQGCNHKETCDFVHSCHSNEAESSQIYMIKMLGIDSYLHKDDRSAAQRHNNGLV